MSGVDGDRGWVTPNNVPDPDPLPEVKGWNLLVRPLAPAEKSKGGILFTQTLQDDLMYLTNIGRVLVMGPLCYKDPEVLTQKALGNTVINVHGKYEESWCKVGDLVCYGKNQGQRFKINDVSVVLLADDLILFKVDDPSSINPSFNLSPYSV